MNDAELNLRAALQLLGPNGERWMRGDLFADDRMCSLGAMAVASGRKPEELRKMDTMDWDSIPGIDQLVEAAKERRTFSACGDLGYVAGYNDSLSMYDFSRVREMFQDAIHRAGNIGEPERYIEFEPLETPAEAPAVEPAAPTPETEPAPA